MRPVMYNREKIKHILAKTGIPLVAASAGCVLVGFLNIPNPNMILLVILSALIIEYGVVGGLLSGGIFFLYAVYFFSDRTWVSFTDIGRQKIVVTGLGILANILLIGRLKHKSDQTQKELLQKTKEMEEMISKLDSVSKKDELTQLKNRYALREDFVKFMNKSLLVMMTDLDNFKRINDNGGHIIGDEALKKYAAILKMVFKEDYVYRYGGDEFLVIVDCTAEDAKRLIEKYGAEMQKTKADSTGSISISMSAGYALGECRNNGDLRDLIKQADKNLYKAKDRGKNIVIGP